MCPMKSSKKGGRGKRGGKQGKEITWRGNRENTVGKKDRIIFCLLEITGKRGIPQEKHYDDEGLDQQRVKRVNSTKPSVRPLNTSTHKTPTHLWEKQFTEYYYWRPYKKWCQHAPRVSTVSILCPKLRDALVIQVTR